MSRNDSKNGNVGVQLIETFLKHGWGAMNRAPTEQIKMIYKATETK